MLDRETVAVGRAADHGYRGLPSEIASDQTGMARVGGIVFTGGRDRATSIRLNSRGTLPRRRVAR